MRRASRKAFTLVELLIVIGIIAILVSLLLAGIMSALSKGPVVQTRTEIAQMDIGIQNVIQTYKLKFVPSVIKLSESGNYPGLNTQSTADYDSVQFLKRMFPRLDCGKYVFDPSTGKQKYVKGTPVDWNRVNGIETTDVYLQGPECLVFFLGGPGNLGFSANPANPADMTSLQPVAFEFKQKRLIPSLIAPGFNVYVDAYATPTNAQPYAYFTSYYSGNDYQGVCADFSLTSDCQAYGIAPYVDPTTGRFVNATSYQIISAGADWKFGLGGPLWNPISGATDLATRDNQANFTGGILASGQQ